MAEGKNLAPHSIILQNRAHLELAGVTDVDSFSDTTVIAYTDFGEVCITGGDLRVDRLSIEGGTLSLDGRVDSITYYDSAPKNGSFLGRLFK